MGIFTNAKILDDSTIFDNDLEIENSDFIPETSIRILSTPGHDPFHCSLLVDANDGKYVVAGDVF
jgi:glyoxylase-like metal-dependent hydrolase (beta-lactamase superfamily II)